MMKPKGVLNPFRSSALRIALLCTLALATTRATPSAVRASPPGLASGHRFQLRSGHNRCRNQNEPWTPPVESDAAAGRQRRRSKDRVQIRLALRRAACGVYYLLLSFLQ